MSSEWKGIKTQVGLPTGDFRERLPADDVALRDDVLWDAIIDSNYTNAAVRTIVQYLAEAGFSIVRTEGTE